MAPDEVHRKLAAIFSADVEGYSRLMGEDEAATVRTLTAYRDVMASLIRQHKGRVVDSPGDNLLADFTSVVDAVQCAVEIQQVLKAKNDELPDNRRMEFRIGINLGDVIVEGKRIYGDGVNITARVESLAEGGGICISGSAYEQIENKLPMNYEYLGEHSVKNIAKPIRIYHAGIEIGDAISGESSKKVDNPWYKRKTVLVPIVAIAVTVYLIWNFYPRSTQQPDIASPVKPPDKVATKAPPEGVASVGKMSYPLPEKPSIAVLPFVNIGGEAEQEYFTDGVTEEIITNLSKVPQLFVIARNSTFVYKGRSVNVQQVGRELGVRYVLEGSVRREGDRVRISAQLIDAAAGGHLWSERYDRDL